MKTKLLISFFFCISICAFSQIISLDQLINLRTKKMTYAVDFLTSKNWQIFEDKKDDHTIIFAYNLLEDNTAEAYITLQHSDVLDFQIIHFQTANNDIYSLYIERLKMMNCRFVNHIFDGELSTVIQDDNSTFFLKSNNSISIYGNYMYGQFWK